MDTYFFEFEIVLILIDLNQKFLKEPSEYEISLSVRSYDKNTAENCQTIYVAEKHTNSLKLTVPKNNRRNVLSHKICISYLCRPVRSTFAVRETASLGQR